MRKRLAAVLALAVIYAPYTIAQSAKRPLTHDDYDAWRSIFTPTLTRDGRYLAYSYMPQDGDGELIIRDVKSGQELREPAGALPPPVIQTAEETNPDEPPPVRSIRILTTSDSRFVVATTFAKKAASDQARREKKRAEDMPKGELLIVNLETKAVTRLPAAKSVQVPARGGAWVAFLKEGPPKNEYGTDLVLRDLSQGTERSFANVLEYSFARDGQTLLYTVASAKTEENGVYAVAPGSATAPAAIVSGKGKYTRLTWNRADSDVIFTTDRDDSSSSPRLSLYRWQRGTPRAAAIVTPATPGLPSPFVVSERGQLAFSRDGRKIYVPVAPPTRPARSATDSTDDRVLVDLWHWQDDVIQPMQRVRANQDRNRTYRGIYHVAEGKYVQLADTTMRTVTVSDDGSRALGMDDAPYRRMVDYDGNYNDIYFVDTLTGQRTLVTKQLRGGGGGGGLQWSPDGRYAAFFSAKQWNLFDATSRQVRPLTSSLGVAVHDEDDDTPDPPGSYGTGGWTRDSKSLLVYDRYDVWQVFVDNQPARNLTEGEGRKARIEFRVQRLEADDDDEGERGIDPAKPVYLRAVSEETRASGIYRDGFTAGTPQRLLWGDKSYRIATRAADADVVLVAASRFDEYPDLHVTDSAFKALSKVTNGGAQLQAFTWGSSELVSFRNSDGVALKAALYKPHNFDPKKKYPMLVYIYEGLSQNVHNFVNPAPSHNINFAYYVSNGYVILTPDIVYTEGQPGQSALKCVLPAIDKVVDMGFVDEARIGIQGHSWGGYQIAYMVTQTNRFRAVEAGAPVGNMTSAYSGIRWGSGLPRQFQYEQTQSRIGRSLYEAPHKYLENSPIFHITRVQTPMLLLHNDNDDAVPWYQGIELYLALRRTGKEAYLFSYNGEFHGLRRRHNQKDFARRMQQFFDYFLKGAAKPEWMEKGIPYLEREEEKQRLQKPTTSP
jgi:dipeptidyl aminopeptidase/acylaminoacyl peptidase